MALADFQNLVDDLVRDDTGKITVADRDQAIGLAVERYGKDRPRSKVEDVAALVTGQVLPLPAGWQADFSKIVSLEHPIGEIPPALLGSDAHRLYDTPTTTQVLLAVVLQAAEQVRATYTVRHTLDAVTDTLPVQDREAVSSWAAALLLDQLASLFSGDSDSTIQADSVDHNSKAREFAARARSARKRYFDELGIDPKRNVAAGAVVDLDLRDSHNRDRLTHPGRFR